MDRAEVLAQAKDALSRLYDSVRLQDHPLGNILRIRSVAGQYRGECLRQLLWDVVESLRPAEWIPPDRPEYLSYNVLKMRYLQLMEPAEIQEELALSPASYYRRQHDGLDAVASILWEKHHDVETGSDSTLALPAAGPEERARDEASRVARESRPQAVSVAQFVRELGHTVEKLSNPRGVSVKLAVAADLPCVYVDPAILHVAILTVLAEAIETQ